MTADWTVTELDLGGPRTIHVQTRHGDFDYTDRNAVREIATWFRSNSVTPTLHIPLFTADDESAWSRHTAATLNLIDMQKASRKIK